MKFIDLKAQYLVLKADIDARIAKVLEHGQYILGPEVDELEEQLSDYTGAPHCISVANGTDALQVALMAIGVAGGDEVIIPGFTYIATAEAIALLGAKPVCVDIEPTSYNIDPTLIESAITNRTKAIIAVSLFGRCADFDAINKIAKRHNLRVIEDGAQSFGATYYGLKSGNLCDIGCTSFFPAKPLGCYGDGGAIFTSDSNLARLMRRIARHGQDRRYHHVSVGINSRLDTIQAAILLAKLSVFDDEIIARRSVAQRYFEHLQGVEEIELPYIQKGYESVWAQYTITTKRRSDLIKFLQQKNIPSSVYYPMPIYKQIAYRDTLINLPECEALSNCVLSLPISPYISLHDQQLIIKNIKSFFQK